MKKVALSILLCALLLCSCSAKQGVKGVSTTVPVLTTTQEYSTTEPTAKAVAGIDSLSANKIVWGPGNIKEHRQPEEPLRLQNKYEALGADWLLKDEKSVCLTFDEGYENGFTPAILDTLKEKQVRAVFFVTYDFAKDNGDLIKRMIDEGHIVGNHSWHHYSMDELDTETARKEVTYLHDYILDTFGYHMEYFRFPKGEFSERALGIVNELGYKSVFWSYAYADWDTASQPDESTAFTGICESTHPGEIMLLHAVSKTNADILGKVIDDIRQQGYTFTTEL
jgi:peptidoglycan-N-acetylmuramic acid deacetylase